MKVLPLMLILVMMQTVHAPALGAQLEAVITEDSQKIEPTFEFFRIVYIDYPEGGEIAQSLYGQNSTLRFSAEYPESKGTDILLEKLNQYLRSKESTSMITDVKLDYKAELVGKEKSASIQYNIRLVPTISDIVIPRSYAELEDRKSLPKMVDSAWRGLSVSGPITIDTKEYSMIDVNNPSSALQVLNPQVYEKVSQTKAMGILNSEIVHAERMYQTPLNKWHSLFDPTPIQSAVQDMGFTGGDAVLTRYSLGECNLETGPCKDISHREKLVIDGTTYTIRSIESQDDATITIEGYVSATSLAGLEIFEISKDKSDNGGNTDPREFPVTIIYGMAGIAVIGAGAMFFISGRKLKSEKGRGQRGIDPSLLRSQETSLSSGSYRTNRGESHLDFDKKDPKKSPV